MAGRSGRTDLTTPKGSEERGSSEPRYLAVARILRPWGVGGMVKVELMTDFPERFQQPGRYYLGEDYKPIDLENSRRIHGGILLKFAGYDTPEESASLRDQVVYIPIEEARSLPEDEYYHFQVVGLEVWTEEGENLGVVTDVWETGANAVYVVDHQGKSLLLPAISQVVLDIDLGQQKMTVRLMEGLLPRG